MKKVFSLLITLAMLISTAVVPMTASAEADVWDGTAADGFASGTGTENNPYIISSAEELAYLAKSTYEALSTSTAAPVSATVSNTAGIYNAYTGVYFKLTADIDLGNKEWTPIGRQGMRFNGTFDGNGHVVKNMKMTTPYMGMGLFGATGINVKVTKLGIEDADFIYSVLVNGATDKPGTIEDASYTVLGGSEEDGRVYATGALVGIFAGGTFEDCYAKDVTIDRGTGASQANVGGLIGGPHCTTPTAAGEPNTVVKVNRCYVNGFKTTGAAVMCLGGIAGSVANNDAITYGCVADFDYCYVVNTDFATTGKACVMTHTRYSANSDAMNVNCYAEKRYNEAPNDTVAGYAHYPKLMTSVTDWDEQLIATGDWSADNEKSPINDGYPVLAWQNTWVDVWDGNFDDADMLWDGNGTLENPYLISSAAELAGLSKKVWYSVDNGAADKIADTEISSTIAAGTVTTNAYNIYKNTYFRLTKDIDLNGKEWLPIGRNGARFDGNFDGNGHVVKNISITSARVGIGLFGATGSDVKISNLGVENFAAKVDGSKTGNSINEINRFGTLNDNVTSIWGSGAMVGIYGGGTFENCYTKNSKFENTAMNYTEMGFGGFAGNDSGIDKTSTAFTNCYVIDVSTAVKGVPAGFLAYVGDAGNSRDSSVTFTNCYVAGTITQDKKGYSSAAGMRGFAGVANNSDIEVIAVNCYSTAAVAPNASNYKDPLAVTSTKAEIESGLVKGDGAFYLDNVKANVNGGYPVLAWQRDWTVATSPASFYKVTAHTAADGAVNSVTIIQSDANVHGTVIVAVYDGTRFVNAVTAKATNGAIPVTGLSAVSENTIKVFVWDSLEGLTPLAAEYSATL